MKVIFLDIDGVLNSHRTCLAFGGYPHEFSEKHMARFDMVALTLIRRIARAAGAVFVLSSAWRIGREASEVAAGLDLPIIDKTPSLSGARGLEIQYWLDQHPEVECYAIIDDDSDMLDSQKPFFVHTMHADGFLWSNAERLAELMGIDVWAAGRALTEREAAEGRPPAVPSREEVSV